jgi:predicted ATPase
MIKFTILGVAAILSTTLATPVLAQAVIQEPSAPSQQRVVFDRAMADAMAFAPPSRSLAPGNETTTRPWSAPIGHRQPGVADVPASTSASQQTLDQEDANVNRIIRGICRGC